MESRRVEVSGSHGGYWIVGKGLNRGERLVVEGTWKILGGIVVKPLEAEKSKG